MAFSRANTPVLHFDDINGRPLVGGLLYTYAAGTNTPATTYRDSAGSEENENPIHLNGRGECEVFLDTSRLYKFVLMDPSHNIIWAKDGISSGSEGGGGVVSSDAISYSNFDVFNDSDEIVITRAM